jgi:ribosome-associated protein
MSDDDTRSPREIARSKRRRAGDRSARVARELMKLAEPMVKKLELDEDLRDSIDRARAVTSQIARRRAERTLAGDLRRTDISVIEDQLAKLAETGSLHARQFHLAEQWRTRLIEEGPAAIAAFPGGGDAELPRLVDAAKRERATGRPPGAARALFRHVVELRKVQAAAPRDEEDVDEDEDEDENDDEEA